MQAKKHINNRHLGFRWKRLLASCLCAAVLSSGSGNVLNVYAQSDGPDLQGHVAEDTNSALSEEESSQPAVDVADVSSDADTLSEDSTGDFPLEDPAGDTFSDSDTLSNTNASDDNNAPIPETVPAPQQSPVLQSGVSADTVDISINSEEDLLRELRAMQDGQTKTLRLKQAITLTQSMQLTNEGSYSVTLIGDGENTILRSQKEIRLFTVKNKAAINLTLDNVVLDGTGKAGGVVVSDSADLTLTGRNGSTIRNMKDTHGAAIRATNAHVELNGVTFLNNYSENNGGAVYAYSSMINADNVNFTGNGAGEDGGAIYQYDTKGNIQLKNCTFTSNTAVYYGGAIAGSATGLTLNSTKLIGNTASYGGGVYLKTGTFSAQLRLQNGSRMEGNTAEYHGGGAYVESAVAGVFIESSSVVTDNHAKNGNGGGLHLHRSANVHLNNSELSKNTAQNGGGMFLYDSNNITCTNAKIENNVARENGGGMYTTVISSISSTTFSGNKAKNGGGMYKSGDTLLVLNMANFTGNVATAHGGAIGLDANAWNISAGMSSFSDNLASYAVETLNAQQQAIHDQIMMTNVAYGTFTYTSPFTHALNNYDVWNTGESVDLVFNANTSDTVTGMPAKQNYAAGATILLPLANPVRTGYTFLGWSEDKNVYVPDYAAVPNAVSKEEQDLWYTMKSGSNTLYAVWERSAVTLALDANGGSFYNNRDDVTYQSVEYDTNNYTLPEPDRRFGYEFVGWYESKQDEVLEGGSAPSGKWTSDKKLKANTTLYACWRQVPFPIGDGQFGDESKYEQLLREAVSSARETINIHLYDDIKLTDAIRASAVHTGGLKVNFVSTNRETNGNIKDVHLTQTGEERHFYVRTQGMKVDIGLENIIVDSDSGYGGIEVSKGTLTLNGNSTSQITGITEHYYGGAILAKDGAMVFLEEITLQNNHAYYGGAVYLADEAESVLDNVMIHNNTAEYAGGGLYVADDSVPVIGTDSAFTDNQAGTHGGGIGLGMLGDDGKKLLENITLTDSSWNNNQSREYVDVVKEVDKVLYPDTSMYDTWNGHNISYLYNIYTVSYDMDDAPVDANTGTPKDTQRYGEGYELTLPKDNVIELKPDTADAADKWNYRTLSGWSEDRYGTKPADAAGKWTFSGDITDITLYPVWEHEIVMVTFKTTGEGYFNATLENDFEDLYPDYEFQMSSDHKLFVVFVEKGSIIPVLDSSYLKSTDSTKHFQYWDNGSGRHDFSKPVTDDSITLTAIWGAISSNEVQLVFHTDGGTYIEPMIIPDTDTRVTVDEPEKTGHEFAGWYTDKETLTQSWDPEFFHVSGYGGKEYHIYAKWEINLYELVVEYAPAEGGEVRVNDGINENRKFDFHYGDQVNLKAVANDGWYFTGWEIKADLSDAAYLSDTLEFTITGDTKVTAQFAKKSYTVTFYEGRRLLDILRVDHGSSFPIDDVPAAPEGYTQTWYTGEGDQKQEVTFNENNKVTGNVAYSRELKKKTYTVNFYGNGGLIGGQGKLIREVEYDEPIGGLTDMVIRDYHTFAGWSTSPDSDLAWDLGADAVHHDMDLYAIWKTMDAPVPVLDKVYAAQDETIDIDLDNPNTLEVKTGLVSFLALAHASAADPVDPERDVLTYRWILTDPSGTERIIRSESELIQYVGSFSVPGAYYCFLEVTNTNKYYSGKTSATTHSEIITIQVTQSAPEASVPVIMDHPGDLTVEVGSDAAFQVFALSADARSTDYEAVLTYQWYQQTVEGPAIIEGATDAEYTFTTDTVGQFLYYVVVTNSITDANGNTTSQSIISNTAKLTVYDKEPGTGTYSVIYSAGGADGGYPPVDSNHYETGDTVTVLDNTGNLAKRDHTFIGWTADPDNPDARVYTAGDTITMGTADLRLYAQWQKDRSLVPDPGENPGNEGNADDAGIGSKNADAASTDDGMTSRSILILIFSGCVIAVLIILKRKSEQQG